MKMRSLMISLILLFAADANAQRVRHDIVDSFLRQAHRSELIEQLQNISTTDKNEILCIAMNIYYEARGESSATKIAVANVTRNRYLTEGFPKTYCGIIGHIKIINGVERFQYSWLILKRPRIKSDIAQWITAQQIAYNMYFDNDYYDNTDGALFFHESTINTIWTRELTYISQIGPFKLWR